MNGYELIQEIRSNPDIHKLRIIMFTGATNRQHLRTLNMDISDFLEKPVSNAKLLESINRVLVPPKPAPPPPKAAPAKKIDGLEYEPEPVPPSLEVEHFERPPAPLPDEKEKTAPSHPKPINLPKQAQKPAPKPVPPPEPALQARPEPQPELPPEPQPEPQAAPQPELPPEPQPEAQAEPQPEAQAEPEPQAEEEVVPEIEEIVAEDDDELKVLEAKDEKQEVQDVAGLENLAADSPLIHRVNKILMAAVDMRASDIHIEPQESRVVVRVRVDGVLKQLTTLPISIHARLTARIKIMCSLNITERRLPQDGQFRVQMRGNRIEFRVSTLPCIKGEKIVMRVLGQSKLNASLSQLDLAPRELHAVQGALKSPNGLILVTGPTGSGKTTTLYTMINVLNKPDVNIMTAEDPVEYEVPNVNQVKILTAVGLTFENTLRAFLRQDPDIMLVGEIRDLETAEISIKASITGHLVFSTLHTNSAPATIIRLTHMGVAPYLVAASVKLVIAQRLVRKLCKYCKAPGPLTEADKTFLTKEEIGRFTQIYHPVGCQHCHGGGYTGRKPVFEVMPIQSSAMRQLITSNYNVDMLNELATSEGMVPLRQAALAAVAQGVTSMQEALKIMMG